MQLKWCQIDPENATKEQLLVEIRRLNALQEQFENKQQGTKIFLNSVYGATGSPWFIFFNIDIAEAVTLQGQELIKYSEQVINRYFSDFWHKDDKLHEQLGIKNVSKVTKPVVVYIDTDSVSADTIIHTSSGDMTIEDLFFLSKHVCHNISFTQKEYAISDLKILNEVEGELCFSPISKIIRHRVTKPKWKLKTSSGKEIIVTNDHSLIVIRDSKKIEIKPSEVIPKEKVICVRIRKKMELIIEEIEYCEEIGAFEDEYVYDIEVDEINSHSFFANNILVHNSNYVTFEEVISSCNYSGDPKDFIQKIYKYFLKEYLNKCFKIFAQKANVENIQDFELEAISAAGIWLGKKKYVYDPVWKDPGIDIESLSHITAKGVEIVQSSTPPYVRKMLLKLLEYIFKTKKNFSITEFTMMLRKYKEEYKLKDIEEIAPSSAIGDYEKFVLQDNQKLILEKGCPIHIRAAALHNYAVNHSKFKDKYSLIRTGEKVKYYVTNSRREEENVFGFIPGAFPIEFAPPIDHDRQFDKSIIQPINRFISVMGFSEISSKLVVSTQLF